MKKLSTIFILAGMLLYPVGGWADSKISAMTSKGTPVAADTTIIVDSADGLNKKITLGTLPAGAATTMPSGSTPSLAAYYAYTDAQTSDLVSPPIVAAIGTKKIIFFTAARAVRFDTSTTLKGNNSVSWTTAAGAWMELNSDGTYWRCAIHNAD